MKINSITGIPLQIPVNATAKLNLRLTPDRRFAIQHLADKQKKSMSKVLIRMIDFYLHHTVGIENSNPEHI